MTKTIGSYFWVILTGLILFNLSGCAKTALQFAQAGKTIVFQLSVKGNFRLDNPNVTYYIIFNVPPEKDGQVDPSTNGPRVNAASLTTGNSFLQGRLPFIDKLPQDNESKWTHFFYIQGTNDGRGNVGIGQNRDNVPIITQQNYNQSFWRRVDASTFELQIQFGTLFGANIPKNVAVNLATSDSIDTGNGFVYDSWRLNVPFSIETATQVPISDQDPNISLVFRDISGIIIGKLPPVLPAGVDANSVDLARYNYVIR